VTLGDGARARPGRQRAAASLEQELTRDVDVVAAAARGCRVGNIFRASCDVAEPKLDVFTA